MPTHMADGEWDWIDRRTSTQSGLVAGRVGSKEKRLLRQLTGEFSRGKCQAFFPLYRKRAGSIPPVPNRNSSSFLTIVARRSSILGFGIRMSESTSQK